MVVAFTSRQRIPGLFAASEFVDSGGLLSYGQSFNDGYRLAASYVDRIWKGANPAELPAQAPAKFEFAINIKAATTLGLTVPPTVLALADEVIE